MTRVAPSLQNPTVQPSPEEINVKYNLIPVHPLPTVDLSVSIRSHLLSRNACEIVDQLMRRWGAKLNLGYTVALLCMPVIMLAPAPVGSVISCVCQTVALPGALFGPTLLRHELVRLLARTFDFWFFLVLVATTFWVLGWILGPLRGISVLTSVLGVMTTVLVDANLRVPKSWVLFSCLAMAMHLATVAALNFEWIDSMHRFNILHVRDHVLPATTFASNGLLTICALLGRSVYRRREAVTFHNRAANSTRVRCVGYRVALCFTATARTMSPVTPPTIADASNFCETSKATTQHLHYDSSIGHIDAAVILCPRLYRWLLATRSHRQHRLMLLIHAVGLASFSLGFLVELTGLIRDQPSQPWVPSLVLGITVAYCFPFALFYQRQLLKELIRSFDFVFLTTQITVAHVCACDFFRWTPRSMTLVAGSWIWIHWVLCIDALTPIVRSHLGFHVRVAAPALTLCFLSSTTLVGTMVFSPSVAMFDRTLWRGIILNHVVHFRLAPLFYNCFFTVFALMLRILVRVATVSNETLLVLDGAVAYENCLARQKKPRQRSAPQ